MDAAAKERSPFWIWLFVGLISLSVVGATFYFFVEAPPPRKLVIATGSKEGAYFKYAQRYAELLAKDGITLEVRPTKGSVENLALLSDDSTDVDVAMVQGGIAQREAYGDKLVSLCSLYREPLWVFANADFKFDRLVQLTGKRVAVGPEGSGTRGIAMQLLQASGIDSDKVTFLDITGKAAAEALDKNEIDAAFFVAGPDAAYIGQLLRSPQVRLVELGQHAAYERRFRFLSAVQLPEGLFDLRTDVPKTKTVLIAPAATLVARKKLHPALVSLLLSAATKTHASGDLLSNPGEFPSTAFTDLPVSEEAVHYFKSGPPVLQRMLPFWLASMADRLKVMVIPLVMVMMPLFRAAPPFVRWRTRRKIYRWYSELRAIDLRVIRGMNVAEAERDFGAVTRLEQQIADVEIPLSYMEEYYNLRLHVNLVRQKLQSILAHTDSA